MFITLVILFIRAPARSLTTIYVNTNGFEILFFFNVYF